MTCRTTRFTIRTIQASDAPIALARSGWEKIRVPGRWPGFAKTECGLHIIEPVPDLSAAVVSKAAKFGN